MPAAAPAHTEVLTVAGVGRRFEGSRWVLRDVTLSIAAGECVVLLGQSGSGKSTLLNLAAGLDQPDAGTVAVLGRPLAGLDEAARAAIRRRHVGFVFQAFHLVAHLRVWQNVALPLLLTGSAEADARTAAGEALRALQIVGRDDALPGDLSGGEQQRVALARALIHRPALILADEPTGNLDPDTAAIALERLVSQCRGLGAALLMVTHSEQAAAVADRRFRLTADGLSPA